MKKINLKNILKKTFKKKSTEKNKKISKKKVKIANTSSNIKKEALQNWKKFENEEDKFEKYFKENI